MNIAEKSGLTELVGRLLSPILRRIFRQSKNNPEIMGAISMNVTANMLGLGNAATPLGIEAMRRIQQENKTPDTATSDMIKFVIINTAALRLVPTTVAVIRQSHGAENPMDIMPASWLASAGALLVGLAIAELFMYFGRKKERNNRLKPSNKERKR